MVTFRSPAATRARGICKQTAEGDITAINIRVRLVQGPACDPRKVTVLATCAWRGTKAASSGQVQSLEALCAPGHRHTEPKDTGPGNIFHESMFLEDLQVGRGIQGKSGDVVPR